MLLAIKKFVFYPLCNPYEIFMHQNSMQNQPSNLMLPLTQHTHTAGQGIPLDISLV